MHRLSISFPDFGPDFWHCLGFFGFFGKVYINTTIVIYTLAAIVEAKADLGLCFPGRPDRGLGLIGKEELGLDLGLGLPACIMKGVRNFDVADRTRSLIA